MIHFDGKRIEFSLEDDYSDLTFVKESMCCLEIFSRKSLDCQMILSLTKDAMLCLGVHMVYMAANDQWGCMRNNPIGDDEAISMGVRPSPLSGTLLFELKKDEKNHKIIMPANNCEAYSGKLFSIDLDKDIEAKYEELFTNTAQIKIYEKSTGNRIYQDSIFRLHKDSMLGFGVTLIRLAHHFHAGSSFFVCRDKNKLQPDERIFPGLLLSKGSADLQICCAELPDRNQYQAMIQKMRTQMLTKQNIEDKIQAISDGRLTREEVAVWANGYIYADDRDRCRLVDYALRQLAKIDTKNEEGEYVYTNEKMELILNSLIL